MFIGSSPEFVKEKLIGLGSPELRNRWRIFRWPGPESPGTILPDQRQFRGITSRPWKWSYKEPEGIDPSFSWKIEKIHNKTESNILILKYKLAFATYSARRIYNKMTKIWDSRTEGEFFQEVRFIAAIHNSVKVWVAHT